MNEIVVFPVVGPTTICSAYGDPRAHGPHHGVDICAPMKTPVLAAASGSVRYGQDPMGGNVALVDVSGSDAVIYNAHLYAFVGENRYVAAGEVIGLVGMTGNAATTLPHLHIELWPTGDYKQPANPTAQLAAATHYATPPNVSAPVPKLRLALTAIAVVGASAATAYAIDPSIAQALRRRLKLDR